VDLLSSDNHAQLGQNIPNITVCICLQCKSDFNFVIAFGIAWCIILIKIAETIKENSLSTITPAVGGSIPIYYPEVFNMARTNAMNIMVFKYVLSGNFCHIPCVDFLHFKSIGTTLQRPFRNHHSK
jgi:hypothetical protein